MVGHKGPFLLLVTLAVYFPHGLESVRDFIRTTKKPLISSFDVLVCPKVTTLKNVDKAKLLGVWFAYATTPLNTPMFRRRCASYNVQNNPYFNTNILFTDYKDIVITYACVFNSKTLMHDIKLRILTRTRTPTFKTLSKAADFLEKYSFPIKKLHFLKSEAFCFEWYQLKMYQKPRAGRFNVPIKHDWDH